MAELKDAKVWGGVGAILTVVGLGFIGFILKLLGVKKISEATGNEEIFSKYLWSAVLAIIASAILFGSFFMAGGGLGLGAIGLGTVIAAILMILAAWFMKQSYDMIASETGVGMFHTVALLYIIGAVLTIVLIGVFLVLIAAILEIVAFFSLPDSVPGKASPSPAEEEAIF